MISVSRRLHLNSKLWRNTGRKRKWKRGTCLLSC